MLSSLCPAMAAIPSVSRFWCRPARWSAGAAGVMETGGDSCLASVSLAGSIASWIVARLFCMSAVRAAPSRLVGATAARRQAATGAAGRAAQEGAASGRRLHGRRGAR
jgi:hypothetical protein